MEKKQKINSILKANQYLIELKLENPLSYKTHTAQNFLFRKVENFLGQPKTSKYKFDFFDLLIHF